MRSVSARNCVVFFVIPLVLGTLSLSLLPSIHGQSSTATSSATPGEIGADSGPILDSGKDVADTAKGRSRQVENRNHIGMGAIAELPGDLIRLNEFWDEIGEKKAIPVGDADAIFVGEVTDAAASLATDRTALFSTFEVKLTQILSNRLGTPLDPGSTLEIERYGGRIKYPDGKVEEVKVEGRRYPKVGSLYVFFLSQTPKKTSWTQDNAEGFNIITAYEVKNGKVYAVDRAQEPGESPSTYEKYDGTSVSAFLSEISSQVQDDARKAAPGDAL